MLLIHANKAIEVTRYTSTKAIAEMKFSTQKQ